MVLRAFRQAEIEQFYFTIRADHHVGWFDVAMQDALPMRCGQAANDTDADTQRLLTADGLGHFGERLTTNVLGNEIGVTIDLIDAMNSDDIRVDEACERSAFDLESFTSLCVGANGCDELQGHESIEVRVLREIHSTHAPATDETQDAVFTYFGRRFTCFLRRNRWHVYPVRLGPINSKCAHQVVYMLSSDIEFRRGDADVPTGTLERFSEQTRLEVASCFLQ